VYWSYGFGSVDIYRYNMNTGEKVHVGASGGCGFMNGSDYASDGRVYISDYCNLYEVDRTANQIVKRANMQMSTIWGIVLSRDERKIYGTPIGGTLYEYDCDKNTLSGIYKTTSVKTNNYTGSGMCDSKGRIYFSVHSGGKGTEGLLQIDVSERTGPAPSPSAGGNRIPRAVMQPGRAAVGPASIAGVYDIRGSLARRSGSGVLVDTGNRARQMRLLIR
jgi:hypothetical protein